MAVAVRLSFDQDGTPMNRKILMICVFVTCFTPIALSQKPTLEPLKPIGVSWNTDEWRWMSFVAFNDNGTEVASDGATKPSDSQASKRIQQEFCSDHGVQS
jgi:hypothetical protein